MEGKDITFAAAGEKGEDLHVSDWISKYNLRLKHFWLLFTILLLWSFPFLLSHISRNSFSRQNFTHMLRTF